MIVVDSSVLFHVLMDPALEPQVLARMQAGGDLAAPHLIDFEVANAIRRGVLSMNYSTDRAEQALIDLQDFTIERYPAAAMLHRIWQLRSNVTAYDASYVALAEFLAVPLLTRDRRLASAAGVKATVVLL